MRIIAVTLACVLGLVGCVMADSNTANHHAFASSNPQSCAVTCVFINGQELQAHELAELQALVGVVQPGRYWLDNAGNAGPEGGPATVNLVYLQQARAN